MAVSQAVRRLLRLREIEEEQRAAALESAIGEWKWLEAVQEAARTRERSGRRLVAESAATGELADRLAGVEQTRSAGRHAAAIEPRIRAAEQAVATRRQEFLAKRVERRQVELLIGQAEAEEAQAVERRAQSETDDWFLRRTR
jgi:hypothetical protein